MYKIRRQNQYIPKNPPPLCSLGLPIFQRWTTGGTGSPLSTRHGHSHMKCWGGWPKSGLEHSPDQAFHFNIQITHKHSPPLKPPYPTKQTKYLHHSSASIEILSPSGLLRFTTPSFHHHELLSPPEVEAPHVTTYKSNKRGNSAGWFEKVVGRGTQSSQMV